MTATSSASPELPAALRHLDETELAELDSLARKAAWARATDPVTFDDREKRLLARAQKEADPAHYRSIRQRMQRHRTWDRLSWFLFGGHVDLVGFARDPRRAYDPSDNPWLQLRVPGFARTQDEHDELSPFKAMPGKEYLRLLAYAWVHEPLLAIPKSRQMMITWLFCAIAAHRVLFTPAQRIAVISKKEEDADALLKRIEVVYKALPPEYAIPHLHKKYAHISVADTHGAIHAMGEEAKGLRSFTFSWVFLDEAAFHEQFMDAVEAALPAVKGGSSRLTLVSTSNGEDPFYDVVSEGGTIAVPAGA